MAGQTVTVEEAKKKHCIYARNIAQVGGFVPCLADECIKWVWVSKTNKEGYYGAS